MIHTETIGNWATIYLGDCREILPTLGNFDALITDPPYGVNLGFHGAALDGRMQKLSKTGYDNYDDTPENYLDKIVPALKNALSISTRGMIFGVPPTMWHLPAPDVLGGIYLPHSVGRNKWGFSSLVHCLMYGTAVNMEKGARATAIYNTDLAEKNGHPTPKPLSWMKWALSLGSKPGDLILDPFMGSGSTGVAALQLGRQFVGIEIEPKYFDIAYRRLEEASRQADLFIEKPPKPKQLGLMDH